MASFPTYGDARTFGRGRSRRCSRRFARLSGAAWGAISCAERQLHRVCDRAERGLERKPEEGWANQRTRPCRVVAVTGVEPVT